jgi:hypothetical protein
MRPIFTANDDFRKSAFLNWRTSSNADILNILVLAEGFMSSAIELARLCLQNNDDKKADMLIFPILANANHGIELYLKAFLWTLNKLMKSDRQIEGGHNIQQILQSTKARLKEYKGQSSLNDFNKETEGLEQYIDELFAMIKATPKHDKMDFARYPISDKYENHFYIDELDNIQIDLENFVNRFEKVHVALDNITSYFFYQELNHEY